MAADPDSAVRATEIKVATAWGVRTDRVGQTIDEFGVQLVEAAFDQVTEEMGAGFAPQSPFGYMVSLLRRGVIQAQTVYDVTVNTETGRLFQRYHDGRRLLGKEGCFCCAGKTEVT